MNELGVVLFWCAVQVTLVTAASLGLLALLRRRFTAGSSAVAVCGLLIVLGVSLLAFSPWPRWQWPGSDDASVPAADGTPQEASVVLSGASPSADGAEHEPAATSFLRDFAAALADGLSRPAAPAAATGAPPWRWPAILAAALVVLAAAGLARLALGLLAIHRLRKRALVVDDPKLAGLVRNLASELGCRGRIEVRESRELTTAATIGWLRPTVLLPGQWREWSQAELRCALAHELAHIQRRDFLACLLAQAAVALHFYHPLVHWLARRMRVELELAADAAVVERVVEPATYVKTLAQMALRQSNPQAAWPARGLLPTHGTFIRRIKMLHKIHHLARKAPWALRAAAVCLLLAAGVLAAGFRGATGQDKPGSERAPAALLQPRAPGLPGARGQGGQGLSSDWISQDAAAVVVLRPSAILARKEFAALAKTFNEGFEKDWGVAIENVEQITFVFHDADLEHSQPRFVFRTVKPQQFRVPFGMDPSLVAKKQMGDVTYYAVPGDMAWFQPDDRTLVVDREQALRAAILVGRDAKPELALAAGWKDLGGSHMALAVSGAALRKMASEAARHPEALAMLSPFSPLWSDTQTLHAGLRVDDKVALTVIAQCRDADGAQSVGETLSAVMTLTKNFIKGVKQNLPGDADVMERAMMTAALTAADSMLKSAKVTQEQNVVRVSASTDVNPQLLAMAAQATIAAQLAARRAQGMNNLRQLAIAMHNYADVYGQFPPAVIYGKDGKGGQPHSWRVELLPYLEGTVLYEKYRFDEPWDSEANKIILAQMPPVFRAAGDKEGSTNTSYFAVVGSSTVFSTKEGAKFSEITDGTSNTLMFVEAKRDVPWTKPEDIEYDAAKPLPAFGGWYEGGFNAAMCDGSVHFIRSTISEKVLRAILTMSGGEIESIYDPAPVPAVPPRR
jgi:beta-lactamase regulating signal transducer with metallopeptidase domain